MTVKPTVSLTDHAYEMARALVENGKYASISSVVQRGLMLVEEEEERQKAELAAFKADLARRAEEPMSPIAEAFEELDRHILRKRALHVQSAGGKSEA